MSEKRPSKRAARRNNKLRLEEENLYQEYSEQAAEEILLPPDGVYREDEEEEPIPPAREPDSPKKRRRRKMAFYAVTIILSLSLCALLSLTVFFKIDTIVVEGETRYAHAEIIASSMIDPNANFLLCDTSQGAEKIIAKYPYIDSVEIYKQLFNKIVIKVKEAKPTSIVEHKGKYYVLSQKRKIIEINNEKKYQVPSILGVKLKSEKLCAYAEYQNENLEKYISEIMKMAEKYKVGSIEVIDVTSPTNIILTRTNGFQILIGSPENLEYKFKTIASVMATDVSEQDVGSLNVSLAGEAGAGSYLKSKVPEQSSKAVSSAEPSKEESSQPSSVQESSEVSEAESTQEEYEEESYEEEEYLEEEEEPSEEEYTEEEEEPSEEMYEESEFSEEEESEYYEEENSEEEEYSEEEEDDDTDELAE